MEGNTKKLVVFVIVAAIALFITAATARARNNNLKISGEYALMGRRSCIYTPLGFNDNLTPIVPASVASNSITTQGICTFKRDGTGTMEGTGVQIVPPPAPSPGTPAASSFDFSFPFTYDVADDGTITIDADENSFQAKYDTGPFTGVTFTFDKFSLSGMVSADHKTLMLGSGTTTIEALTLQLPTPVVLKVICNDSFVFIRLGP
jgi:hypothetical protein